jgi:hypothetical protein
VAREVVAHHWCRTHLSHTEEKSLTSMVETTGLGLGTIPVPLMADLHKAAQTSEIAIERALNNTSALADQRVSGS